MKTVSRLLTLVVVAVLAGALVPATRGQDRPAGQSGPAEAPAPETAIAPVDSGASVAPVGSLAASRGPVAVNPLERLLLNRQLTGAQSAGTRDPFETSVAMKRAAADASGDPRYVPLSGAIPKLSLRGYVEPRDKPPCALIEVEGQGTYVVRKNDTIGLTIAGRSSVLKVVSIEQSSARVEAGQLGQVIIVR